MRQPTRWKHKADSLTTPFLSIIIPVYNEEKRLPISLRQILEFLQEQSYPAEVLVVENGSQDATLEIAQSFAKQYPQIRVLKNLDRGKGLAIQRGMLEACGEFRFMCDVDLSMPIQEINRFLPPVLDDFEVAIASREAPGAVRYDEPPYRHFVGRGFNTLIRLIALPGLDDTQCGFKCVRGAIANQLFKRQTLIGWSFDVEILFIARHLGYRVVEVPIPWYFNPDSKIRVLRDSFHMGMDLLTIRLNALRGNYDHPV
jgi:glycosyltransferase involved in cell wall biosynthesis